MRSYFKSIHTKMIFFIGLVFIFCIGITSFLSIRIHIAQEIKSDNRNLNILTNIVERSLYETMLKGRGKELQSILMMIGSQKYIDEVRIFSVEGIILKSADPKEIGQQIGPQYLKAFREKHDNITTDSNGIKVRSVIKPILNQPRCYSCHDPKDKIRGILNVGVSLAYLQKDISFIYKLVITSSLLTLLIMAIVGIAFQWKLVRRPIKDLMEKIKAVEDGDLNSRVKLSSNDELGTLGKSFNSMIEKLDYTQKEIKKYHQEQMARSDRLASLGELASGIAHEVRNTMAGISGVIQVFADDFDPGDPKREITSEILNKINRLNNIIKDILTYSRPLSPRTRNSDLHKVLDDALFLIIYAANNSKVRIKKDYDSSISEISLDPDQVQQVFLNIFLNAIQAMPHGGDLMVKTKLWSGNSAKRVTIEVEDNGVGMSPDTLKNIFHPFFSTKHTGTGLGLSVAQSIIEQHEGNISALSELGKGTTFVVTLPLQELG